MEKQLLMDTLLLGTTPLIKKAQQLLATSDEFNIISVVEIADKVADDVIADKKLTEIKNILGMSTDVGRYQHVSMTATRNPGVATPVDRDQHGTLDAATRLDIAVDGIADKDFAAGVALLLAVPNQLAEAITAKLKDAGINGRHVYFIPHYAYDLVRDRCVSADEILVNVDIVKPRLNYLEYQVCDHCNLNCKGCTHYCNISEEKYADIESYTRDLRRMKELFWGIAKIRLMGGEPLLNKDLPRFIKASRDVFPDAEIRVVTNGLLIPHMDQALGDTMKRAHCEFDITLYQPTAYNLESITKTLEKYGIKSSVTTRITKFIRFKTLRPRNNPEKSAKHCRARNCHFLMDGRLAKCSEPILVEKLNRRFSTDFSSLDVHNLYDKNVDAWELRKQLEGPIDFCRYCVAYPDKFHWQRCDASDAKVEDWIVPSWKVPFLNCLHFYRVYFKRTALVKVFWRRMRLPEASRELPNKYLP